ncbi:MAG: phosphatase PAP2 family protein [Proteobacteria bacterium]|nr:phosphatase PAP2 family protein [Pseudomonadota bacterium]
MQAPDRIGPLAATLAALLLAALIFAAFPRLDLAVSGAFYVPGDGFPLGGQPLSEGFRLLVWNLSNLMAAAALAGAGICLATGRKAAARVWTYILALYLLAPILLVNVGLKSHWGRARPADVGQFGGAHAFTPFWQPADQCSANCSFVSGEVSAATALAVSLFCLTRLLPAPLHWSVRIAALLLAAATIFQRVSAGRHFLSDATFAVLLTLLVAVLLRPLLSPRHQAPPPC